jgi:hypothetical protein
MYARDFNTGRQHYSAMRRSGNGGETWVANREVALSLRGQLLVQPCLVRLRRGVRKGAEGGAGEGAEGGGHGARNASEVAGEGGEQSPGGNQTVRDNGEAC